MESVRSALPRSSGDDTRSSALLLKRAPAPSPVVTVDRAAEALRSAIATARYVARIADWRLRAVVGFAVAVGGVVVSLPEMPASGMLAAVGIFIAGWLSAVALTDKYVHKYPYRYYSYLFASHAKAAVILALTLGVATWFLAGDGGTTNALWHGLGWFVVADLALALPRRVEPLDRPFDPSVLTSRDVAAQADASALPVRRAPLRDLAEAPATVGDVSADLGAPFMEHVCRAVKGFHDGMSVVVLSGAAAPTQLPVAVADLVFSRTRVNDIRRINRFFLCCCDALKTGGYLTVEYEPLESRRATIAQRYGSLFWLVFLLDFVWHRAGPKIPGFNKLYFVVSRGKGRALSKAEVWGRLSYCGMKVVSEHEHGSARFVTAKLIAPPITNKRPSYYPVVGLTKVGLDGELLQTHKVRSMYPYSEFLQKQIFEANGLVGTGKLKNDFRLTEYGKFLRRHWIDELPQIYDWLRGDIKLVGIRATSPHFLSLYPPDFTKIYVLVKPGLVPPLFEEGTEGFAAIVDIEYKYLCSYARRPFATDMRLLWATFVAIVFRGVRSK